MGGLGGGIRRLLAVLVASMLVGCAATGPKFAEVRSSMPAVRAGEARLVVYRPPGLGPAVQPMIRLDGVEIGKSEPEGFFFVDRPAGAYTVSARTEAEATLAVQLEEGRTTYVETGITIGIFVGRVTLSVQSDAVALGKLGQLAYTGSIPLVAGRPADAVEGGNAAAAGAGHPVTLDDLRGLLPSKS